MFEGGLRVPAIVNMPGTIPAGEVSGQLARGTDWFPTIADYASVELPDRVIAGRSLRRVIASGEAPSPHETVHWQTWRGERASWAVREGAWKLIANPRDPTNAGPVKAALFLSNLEQDATEMTNLADDYPEVVERLRVQHEELVHQIEPDGL